MHDLSFSKLISALMLRRLPVLYCALSLCTASAQLLLNGEWVNLSRSVIMDPEYHQVPPPALIIPIELQPIMQALARHPADSTHHFMVWLRESSPGGVASLQHQFPPVSLH